MQFNKGFNGVDGAIYRVCTEQGRQRARHPAGNTPDGQKPAAMRRRHELLHDFKVMFLSSKMMLCKFSHRIIARKREYTPINRYGTGLTRVIRAQCWNHVCRDSRMRRFDSRGNGLKMFD